MSMQREAKEGPRINEDINTPEVFLIDAEGVSRGKTPVGEALTLAEQAGLDLVEINPHGNPPVVKILDYGKFKYQAQKKAAEAKKRQKVVEIKEIKLRPNIDTHDYEVKARAMRAFFEEGDKVKVTLRFRGRELAHTEIGVELLNKVQSDFQTVAKVEQFPKMEGKQMVMVMAPR
jgi:translation initiation factor IF-3